MESIIEQKEGHCYICNKVLPLEEHHVFYGTANRKLSEKHGLKVRLCHNCHNEPPYGVHHNREFDTYLKQDIQQKAMTYYNWSVEDFIKIFGRSYL